MLGISLHNSNSGRAYSLRNMTDQEFDAVQAVHLRGAYSVSKAAWPIFRKQKFGRIVNTASAAGLFGALLFIRIMSQEGAHTM